MTSFGSFSEFGKLREVVVGSAQDLHLPPFGEDLSHYVPELREALLRSGSKPLDVAGAFPERYEKTVEQMESVATTYERQGIKVRRPRAYTEEEKAQIQKMFDFQNLHLPSFFLLL